MGQQEVYDFLKKQDKPVGRRQIAEAVQSAPSAVGKVLRVMIKHKEISFITLDYKKAREKYGLKKRTREYYIKKNKS